MINLNDLAGASAKELENLIAEVGKLRAQMEPAVQREAPVESAVIFDPLWYTRQNEFNTLIQIRHPGLGWISFALTPESRAYLLSLLLHQALTVNTNLAQFMFGGQAEKPKGKKVFKPRLVNKK